jgi:hypothetical protein
MESDTSLVSALRSRSTELPGGHEPAIEKANAASAENSARLELTADSLAGACSEAVKRLSTSSRVTHDEEKAEMAESLPEAMSPLTAAVASIGVEPLTASTLQRHVPISRHRSTAPSYAPVEHLTTDGGTKHREGEATGSSKAAPESVPEHSVPSEAEKRGMRLDLFTGSLKQLWCKAYQAQTHRHTTSYACLRRQARHVKAVSSPSQHSTFKLLNPGCAGKYASFWTYCQAECDFSMKGKSSSSLFGETTRDKLYNSLFLVGPHLERYMAVGFLKCLDYLLVRSLDCPCHVPRDPAHRISPHRTHTCVARRQ